MSFLPIVERELRVAARRPATYWTRFFAAVCVLIVWFVLVVSSRQISTAALSQHLFIAFGVLALGFALFAGVALTADCLSEERREGTLGLLFLTDLRGYDVVLGKLIGTSVRSAYGLFAIFPILGLPLLMGGVTGGEFWRIVLVLLATLFLSLSLGMLVSSLNRDARQAVAGTFLGILLLSGLLPALWWLGFVLTGARPSATILLASPPNLFRAAFDFCYRARNGPHEFWQGLQVLLLLALVLLVGAAVCLPRIWREKTSPALLGGWCTKARATLLRRVGSVREGQNSFPLHYLLSGFLAGAGGLFFAIVLALFIDRSELFDGLYRGMGFAVFPSFGFLGILLGLQIRKRLSGSRETPSQRLESNPFLWLASRDRGSVTAAWVILSFLSLLWLCFLTAAISGVRTREAFVLTLLTSFAMHMAFKWSLAVETTRELNTACGSSALELLLVSPLSENQIIEGHTQALQLSFAGVRCFLVAMNVCLSLAIMLYAETLSLHGDDLFIFFIMFCGGILMLFLDFKAFDQVGILMALRCKRHNRAILATLGRVMGIPWAVIFLIWFLGINGALSGIEPVPLFLFWFGVGITYDLIITFNARSSLRQGFRYWLLDRKAVVEPLLSTNGEADAWLRGAEGKGKSRS